MKIALTEQQRAQILAFLEGCEDAEQLSEGEYVVDLYDIPKPVSLDIILGKTGIGVEGAAELKYDASQDGWYMGERLERPEEVLQALGEAGAFKR